MCGRFALAVVIGDLEERFEAHAEKDLKWEPRYNIPPKSDIPLPIILTEKNKRVIKSALWGLQPSFIADKNFRKKYSTFNAKKETLLETRSYKPAVQKNQFCLVPMTGFYEWYRGVEPSQPIYIKSKNEDIIAMAGLWDEWIDKKSGEILTTFTIITTTPNAFMKKIHHRMPVLLPKDVESELVNPKIDFEMKLKNDLKGVTATEFDGYPVSREYVNFRKDEEKCIQPTGQDLKSVL